jgi:hypothetical protein
MLMHSKITRNHQIHVLFHYHNDNLPRKSSTRVNLMTYRRFCRVGLAGSAAEKKEGYNVILDGLYHKFVIYSILAALIVYCIKK